jgi:DNA polymerase-3 subunit delta
VVAGALRKTSSLLKLAESHPLALGHASFAPEGRNAEAMVAELARAEGLRPQPGVAARIAEACDNDRRIAGQELAKFALFVGASADEPKDLGHDALDSLGADMGGDFLRIADLALGGELEGLGDELSRLASGGKEAIPVLRSVQRRLLMLAPLRARMERGERAADVVASAGKSVFWKEKALVEKLLKLWDAAGLARVAERAGMLEREMMLAGVPQEEALGEELIAIARQAARRR